MLVKDLVGETLKDYRWTNRVIITFSNTEVQLLLLKMRLPI